MDITLNNIVRQYTDADKAVLNDISLKIPEGGTYAIVGPSGSGKSTLLNLLGTLDFPDSGEVILGDITTTKAKPEKLESLRNSKIGFIFQTHMLLPQLTVLENILLPVVPREKAVQNEAVQKAKDLLEQVGLTEKIDSFPGKMSIGECQRVAVVRSLINEPELLLADEPTGSLDGELATKLIDLLLKLQKQHGFTLITVTHSMEVANQMETIYKLTNGKLAEK
jgi:ABC-type lipoprotein export system ATPase subunit